MSHQSDFDLASAFTPLFRPPTLLTPSNLGIPTAGTMDMETVATSPSSTSKDMPTMSSPPLPEEAAAAPATTPPQPSQPESNIVNATTVQIADDRLLDRVRLKSCVEACTAPVIDLAIQVDMPSSVSSVCFWMATTAKAILPMWYSGVRFTMYRVLIDAHKSRDIYKSFANEIPAESSERVIRVIGEMLAKLRALVLMTPFKVLDGYTCWWDAMDVLTDRAKQLDETTPPSRASKIASASFGVPTPDMLRLAFAVYRSDRSHSHSGDECDLSVALMRLLNACSALNIYQFCCVRVPIYRFVAMIWRKLNCPACQLRFKENVVKLKAAAYYLSIVEADDPYLYFDGAHTRNVIWRRPDATLASEFIVIQDDLVGAAHEEATSLTSPPQPPALPTLPPPAALPPPTEDAGMPTDKVPECLAILQLRPPSPTQASPPPTQVDANNDMVEDAPSTPLMTLTPMIDLRRSDATLRPSSSTLPSCVSPLPWMPTFAEDTSARSSLSSPTTSPTIHSTHLPASPRTEPAASYVTAPLDPVNHHDDAMSDSTMDAIYDELFLPAVPSTVDPTQLQTEHVEEDDPIIELAPPPLNDAMDPSSMDVVIVYPPLAEAHVRPPPTPPRATEMSKDEPHSLTCDNDNRRPSRSRKPREIFHPILVDASFSKKHRRALHATTTNPKLARQSQRQKMLSSQPSVM